MMNGQLIASDTEGLILYEPLSMIDAKNMEWSDRADALMEQTICQSPSPSMQDSNDAKILHYYYVNIGLYGGKTDLDDIVRDIHEYNRVIITKIANIYYENSMHQNYIDIPREVAIEEITDGFVEGEWHDKFVDLPTYVANLLTIHNLYILIPRTYEAYEDNFYDHEDFDISMNDCQNVILPRFLTEGQSYFAPFCMDVTRVMIRSA